jgi:predicted nucleic acid-binding Zn ribbon protein
MVTDESYEDNETWTTEEMEEYRQRRLRTTKIIMIFITLVISLLDLGILYISFDCDDICRT